ncbi:conserved hypothetical protein [Methanocaldococcus sp. FS406-22]|uniref:hypothetical protein n=1 Tax=Methanocaldococcus sp. (strain FS406-22) TaxID=644281 RepID=UPI0001C4E124|nr:hypothetical protein [Methanocaldococcus sp. FS406-22]ADC68952.1 conserved hypothetical protein [Methanocaldococcus sp. FS406-22]
MPDVRLRFVNSSIVLITLILTVPLLMLNCVSGLKTIFYDDFENWSGWYNYSNGAVEQSSNYSYSGTYSLRKFLNDDPNGGYKLIGKEIGRNIVVEGWIYRPTPYVSGKWDRIGIEDENFNGYSIRIEHDYNIIAIETRVGGIASSTLATATWNPPENEWYHFKFYLYSNGTLKLEVYYENGSLGATVSTTDNTYTKFDRVVVHGGQDYYVDDLRISDLYPPLRVRYIEEYNATAIVDGTGKTDYSSGLTGHIVIENTAPYEEDTLNDVWVAVDIKNNASGLRLVYNGTPKGVFIKDSAPAYTGLPSGLTYIHIPILPNNSYVEYEFDIDASQTLPILVNETYDATKIPANKMSEWTINLTVYLNKNLVPNGENVNVKVIKYLSNGQFYDNFENWTGWEQYRNGIVQWSSSYSHSGNYSLEKYGVSTSLNNDPNGGFKLLPKEIGRDVVISGWIYRPSNWGGGPIDRIGLEDENFNGYSFRVDHYNNYISIDRRTGGNPQEISIEVPWNPPEDEWYYFEFHIYSNGTLTFSTYYKNGSLGATVSTTDNTYTKFDRVVVHGGYVYYVDDLEVNSKNFDFYGDKNWTYLEITSANPSEGVAVLFDGDYFKKDYNTSNLNAINWSNITLNWSNDKATLVFNVLGSYSYSERDNILAKYGFAKILFNYNGTNTNTSIKGVYASGCCAISTSHGTTGEINIWKENATFKNNAKSYSFNLTNLNIWAVNKSAYEFCWNPFNESIWIDGSNYTVTPNIDIPPGGVWNSKTYNFTFSGVPIVWANCTFTVSKKDYILLNETSQIGNSYIVIEEIYVVGSYLVKVTKHIVPNDDGTYDIYIVVENIGSEKTPEYVYVYDLVPKNFTVSDEWVNQSSMLIASGSHTITTNPRYNLSMWWALHAIYPGADGDGSYTDWSEISANETVVIHYKLNGTGEFYPSDAFIVGIDPTNSLLPTTSPKITTVSGTIENNFETFLILINVIFGLGILIKRI